jgi:site-specific recombinase XerC
MKYYRETIGRLYAHLRELGRIPDGQDVLQFIAAARAKGWRVSMINIHLRAIRAFLRWGVTQELLQKNPM